MMDSSTSYTILVTQLKALNRTWCSQGCNYNENGSRTPARETGIDTASKIVSDSTIQELDNQDDATITVTALEKARFAISNQITSLSSDKIKATIDLIVPYIFSALREKEGSSKEKDDAEIDHKSPTFSQQSPPRTKQASAYKYNLRQIEWHVVLLLELWSFASGSTRERISLKSMILEILAYSILQHRNVSRRKDKNVKEKGKRKRKRHRKNQSDQILSAKAMSEKDKEILFLDHLVQVLSRAPFLLPRNVSLSEFLVDRIFCQERLFWERLEHVVAHIFDTFEISNLFLRNRGKIDESVLISSENYISTENASLRGKKISSKNGLNGQKRKLSREKLQAIAKNKKRQRLASLVDSKKAHRGSHFHGNFDDISKLLNKKKKKTESDPSSNIGGKKVLSKPVLRDRKASCNNYSKTTRHDNLEKSKPSERKKFNHQTKKNLMKTVSKVKSVLATDKTGTPNENKFTKVLHRTNNNDNTKSVRSTKTSDTEDFPVTPRKTPNSCTSLIVGETPVPTIAKTVVGETPSNGGHTRVFETMVAETPTSENNFGPTPKALSYNCPSFRAPVMPSPTKLAPFNKSSEEEIVITRKQPAKLFGTVKLLKRTNSIGARGEMKSWEGNTNNRVTDANREKWMSGVRDKRRVSGEYDGPSSIDKARAFLRSKSL